MKAAASIKIRPLRKSDLEAVAFLIGRTYAGFNRREGTPERAKRYLGLYDYRRNRAELEEKFLRAPICLVAVAGTKVVGVLRGRDEWIVNLFVDGRRHRQGIGSRLLAECERAYRRRGLETIRVNSSLFAIPFYRTLGFKKVTGVRSRHGVYCQPMKKKLGSV